jgi:hypothetical protein
VILHYIPKDQLRTHWEFIKHGLEIVRSKGHPEWLVEDVYCDCYEQRSMLFLAVTDNKPYGFVVLQPIGNTLHIWAAWSSINDELLLQQALQEVQIIAKQGNKDKVTFSSGRKGWERKAKELGFKPQTWEYILEK